MLKFSEKCYIINITSKMIFIRNLKLPNDGSVRYLFKEAEEAI